jgi:hypothetical protein
MLYTSNLLFWVWVEYKCPGHGKGSWDGLGAMTKTEVTRDYPRGLARHLTDSNVIRQIY